ncbi:MAG: ankyrin repeat domain-containing protein [Verrucomicrobiales bacterium]|nr:ankyrin repeat domain-containing protein [Verrucomicrobiales bacterium]
MSSTRPEWYQFRDVLERADFSAASALLEGDSSLLHKENGIGESVLHFLAVENNQPAIEWLHTRGADLNATNKFGTPLLFEMAQLGYRDLLLWLVEHGADPKRKDAQGQRIDEYLAEFDKPEMIEFIKQHITP